MQLNSRAKALFVAAGLFLLVAVPQVGQATVADTFSPLEFDPSDNNDSTSLTTVDRITFISSGQDPLSITFNLINLSLSFIGMISLGLLVYAGALWFRAGDNEENAIKAKKIMRGTVTALIITLGAFSLSTLLFNVIADSAGVGETALIATQLWV